MAVIDNLHYANINDLAWNHQGKLVACSSDGYVSIIQSKEISDLEKYDSEELPEVLRDHFKALSEVNFEKMENEVRQQMQTQFVTVTLKKKAPAVQTM